MINVIRDPERSRIEQGFEDDRGRVAKKACTRASGTGRSVVKACLTIVQPLGTESRPYLRTASCDEMDEACAGSLASSRNENPAGF